MPRGIKRQVKHTHELVSKEIAAFASRGGKYAGGLASEGYNGGYRDALSDVLLALNGVRPNRNDWWPRQPEKRRARARDSSGKEGNSDVE